MSGNKKKPLICLDSCVFLAWFNREDDKPLEAIESLIRGVVDDKQYLLVSVVSYGEVLDKAGKSSAGKDFREFVKRPNIVVANLDARIAERAGVIREYGLEALKRGELSQGLKIPDCFIVATAAQYNAIELVTFDPVLLEVSGWPIINRLPIARPDNPPFPLLDRSQK